MSQWQARVESASGAIVMFGLVAADGDAAEAEAMRLAPFDPVRLAVTELAHPLVRTGG